MKLSDFLTALIFATLLGNCSSSPPPPESKGNEKTNLSFAEAAEIIASDVSIEPGLWETVGKTTNAKIAELPGDSKTVKAIIARMRIQLANTPPFTTRSCLQPQNPDRPLVPTMPGVTSEECIFDSFRFENGVAESIVNCPASERTNKATMQIKAEYKPTEITIESTTKTISVLENVPHPAEISAKITMKRVGPCNN